MTHRKYTITTKPETTNYSSFEHDIWNIQIGPRVYHQDYITPTRNRSKGKQCQLSRPDNQSTKSCYTKTSGHNNNNWNFNIHINDPEDQDAQTLQDTLNAFNLKQHVNIPTHNLGHTTELIITSNDYMGKLIPGLYI